MKVYIFTVYAMKNVPLYFRLRLWQFLIDFDTFCTLKRGLRNYSTKHVQTVLLHNNYVSIHSIVTGKTKKNTKTADRLLQFYLMK